MKFLKKFITKPQIFQYTIGFCMIASLDAALRYPEMLPTLGSLMRRGYVTLGMQDEDGRHWIVSFEKHDCGSVVVGTLVRNSYGRVYEVAFDADGVYFVLRRLLLDVDVDAEIMNVVMHAPEHARCGAYLID